jgi:hypothetical protein
MRVPWLADVLRGAGLTVHESAGWRGRGKELAEVNGVVAHHTATGPNVKNSTVVALLIQGRPDLAGPLCQLGLRRDGSFDLIADGKGNHNGFGEWANQSIGIEAYNDGIGEPWPSVQIDAYQRGCAAICDHLGLPASKVKGHKETDPGRKIDPAGIDMGGFRLGVASLMNPATPTPPPGGFLMALTDAQQKELYLWVKELRSEVILPKEEDGATRMDRLVRAVLDIKSKVGA